MTEGKCKVKPIRTFGSKGKFSKWEDVLIDGNNLCR